MTDQCLFCRIAAHESPAHVLYEDELLMAFLDLCPVRPGHTLIIPRQHFDYFDDLPEGVITPILRLGQKLAVAMKGLYGVPRVGFLFTGGDLPHAHAHVVPLQRRRTSLRSNTSPSAVSPFAKPPACPTPSSRRSPATSFALLASRADAGAAVSQVRAGSTRLRRRTARARRRRGAARRSRRRRP